MVLQICNSSDILSIDEETTTDQTTTDLFSEQNSNDSFQQIENNYDIVQLNVGGQKFQTNRSTLTVFPNSKLGKIFQIDPVSKRKVTSYFFDYDPDQFSFLLDQLRAIKYQPNFRAYDANFEKLGESFNKGSLKFSMMIRDLELTSR